MLKYSIHYDILCHTLVYHRVACGTPPAPSPRPRSTRWRYLSTVSCIWYRFGNTYTPKQCFSKKQCLFSKVCMFSCTMELHTVWLQACACPVSSTCALAVPFFCCELYDFVWRCVGLRTCCVEDTLESTF